MTYILTVRIPDTNQTEYVRAENAKQFFDMGQDIIKQGKEIIDIKTTSTDDYPFTVEAIKQSLISEEEWKKLYLTANEIKKSN